MDMSLSKIWEMVKDREAWRAAVHRVPKSRTWRNNWTTVVSQACTHSSRAWRVASGVEPTPGTPSPVPSLARPPDFVPITLAGPNTTILPEGLTDHPTPSKSLSTLQSEWTLWNTNWIRRSQGRYLAWPQWPSWLAPASNSDLSPFNFSIFSLLDDLQLPEWLYNSPTSKALACCPSRLECLLCLPSLPSLSSCLPPNLSSWPPPPGSLPWCSGPSSVFW